MEQTRQPEKTRWRTLLRSYKYVLLVAAAGILCLLWPSRSSQEAAVPSAAETMDLERVQAEMEEILGTIQGVGQLRLMLTVDAGAQRELAGDTSLSYSGSTTAARSSATVIFTPRDAPFFPAAFIMALTPSTSAAALEATAQITSSEMWMQPISSGCVIYSLLSFMAADTPSVWYHWLDDLL